MPTVDLTGRKGAFFESDSIHRANFDIAAQIKTKSEFIYDLLKDYVNNRYYDTPVFNDFKKLYYSIVTIRQFIEKKYDFEVDYIIDVIVSNSTKILLEDILMKLELRNQVLLLERAFDDSNVEHLNVTQCVAVQLVSDSDSDDLYS